MKPTLTKTKRFGRKAGYVATLGPIDIEAQTPAEARMGCECAAADALERLADGMTIRTMLGHTIIVCPTVWGWSYWLDTMSDGYHATGRETKQTTITSAQHHLAQYLWTRETDDAAFLAELPATIQSDLRSWIRFQRAYAQLQAEGYQGNIHAAACRIASAA